MRVSHVTPVSFASLVEEGETEGEIAFGEVQRVTVGAIQYYAIHDGAWWTHEGLAGFFGQTVAISFQLSLRRVAVLSYPKREYLATLETAPAEA